MTNIYPNLFGFFLHSVKYSANVRYDFFLRLSFIAIYLVPVFNDENPQKIYSFLNACEFVIQNFEEPIQSILLEAIQTIWFGR